MAKFVGDQLSLIADFPIEDRPIGDWDYDDIGTDKIPVPIFRVDFRVTEKWQPPTGLLEQKWIQDRKYWYWRYYDNLGKKRSLYLGKDYNKAVRKAQKIGIPDDAKHQVLPSSDPQRSATHLQSRSQASTGTRL